MQTCFFFLKTISFRESQIRLIFLKVVTLEHTICKKAFRGMNGSKPVKTYLKIKCWAN